MTREQRAERHLRRAKKLALRLCLASAVVTGVCVAERIHEGKAAEKKAELLEKSEHPLHKLGVLLEKTF